MRIRKLLPFAVIAAACVGLGLVGCEPATAPDTDELTKPKLVDRGQPPLPEPPANNGHGRGASVERPIKGVFKDYAPVWVVSHFSERACNGLVAGAEVKSRGNVSHLGLTTVTASAAWDWATPAGSVFRPSGPVTGPSATILPDSTEFCSQPVTATGRVTLAAANGDVLYGIVAGGEVYELGYEQPGDGQEQFMIVTVDGGTGRFVEAEGQFVIHSIFDLGNMKMVRSEIMPGGRIRY